ncbi:MAG: ImmA/IrrE family metallo-endopeptidase [Saccharofermentans sp.]|nr:ImmA/IrrE family metallo-endopeptidase [Saccharofermentans sp.]
MSKNKLMNNAEIELVIAQMLDRYFKEKNNGKIMSSVDIDDFVLNFLECQIIYESIACSSNTLGYVSDGFTKLKVFRKGRIREVLFPKDTIVLDKYLCSRNSETKRRFVLGHEAGHVITNRLYHQEKAYFNRDFDNLELNNSREMLDLFNIYEMQANRISACILIPKLTLMKHLENAFKSKKVIKYDNGTISRYDRVMLQQIADEMKVSFSALMARLNELDLFEIRPLPYPFNGDEVIVYE